MQLSERLRFIRKHLKLKQEDFAKEIGLKQGSYSDLERGRTESMSNSVKELLKSKFNVSIEWIENEIGEAFTVENIENRYITAKPQAGDIKLSDLDNYRLVPLYSLDVVGGISNKEADINGFVTGYMPFVNAKQDDICVPVTGDSMAPLYPPGSIVQIRKIEMWEIYVELGKVHIIELQDERRLIKVIRSGKDEEHFRLVSANKEYDDTQVPKGFIRSIWSVVAKYQKEVM